MSDVGSVGEWAQVARQAEQGYDPCTPRFYMRAVPNPRESEIQGRQVFLNKPYVEIFIPGEDKNRPNRRVTDADKERWPTAWARFEATKEEATEGTPIEVWSYLNPAQVAELRVIGIRTMEGLANIPDGQIGELGPNGRDLVKRAQHAVRPQDSTVTDLRRENDTLQAQLNELKMEMEHLKQALEAASKPKRRGRPPKARDHGDTEADLPSGA